MVTIPRLPDEIVRRSTNDLIPYARNARTHSPAQVSQIAASIKEVGFTNPILIDGDNGIIAGHGRVLAAHLLELDDVPCIVLPHLTPTQRRAYVLADNKLALNAGWDLEILSLEIGELKIDGFDLALTGFGELELVTLFTEKTTGRTDPRRCAGGAGAPGYAARRLMGAGPASAAVRGRDLGHRRRARAGRRRPSSDGHRPTLRGQLRSGVAQPSRRGGNDPAEEGISGYWPGHE